MGLFIKDRGKLSGQDGDVRFDPPPSYFPPQPQRQERKKDLVGLQGQLDAVRATSAETQKGSRRRENDLAQKLATAKVQLGTVEAAAERTKDEQLAAVLTGSHEVNHGWRIRGSREWRRQCSDCCCCTREDRIGLRFLYMTRIRTTAERHC